MAMPELPGDIAYCDSCGNPMNVASVAPFSNVTCPTCGKLTRVKREFGPYTLVRRHAIGGMSMVFVAHDQTLDREVALKILSEDFSTDERRISAFEEEARITASFSHPHVVRVLTTGKAFGRLYIAMELVPGGHFEHQIRERGKISEHEMLPFAIEIAEGLRAAHAAGLIHRDIKPGNVLLDADGHAKIVDFGLALVTQGGKAQATEIWATPYYVPPETIEGHPEDFRSDIYAFGATLYHALAGQPSCGEESMATNVLREAKKKVVPLGRLDPTLSAATCAIVDKAMAYSPDDRFSSYDEMILLLQGALKRLTSGETGVTESSGSAAQRRARRKRAERLTIAGAAIVLLGGAGVGIWWVTRKDPHPELRMPPAKPAGTALSDPAATNASASDVARNYRSARVAVEELKFTTAADGFSKLLGNPSAQEPTRTWAGVEAVVAYYLDGESAKARDLAKETITHVRSLPGHAKHIDDFLVGILEKTQQIPAIPTKGLDTTSGMSSHVMGWMLAGLKDWEQGLIDEAKVYFLAVTKAKVSGDDSWVSVYQTIAARYLEDHEILSSEVFQKYPADPAGCEAAVAELDQMIGYLKTKGRAKFNMRAWQLDLTKHSRLLELRKSELAAGIVDLAKVMEKLAGFASECRFADAARYLKALPSDPQGATRVSLLTVVDASLVFLSDLEVDLGKQAVSGAFSMKAGESARQVSFNSDGGLTTIDAGGTTRIVKWSDFSADAVIAMHRIFVANPMSDFERVRRHECAIAYDWLAGNRERALAAAAVVAQGSFTFKQHWKNISSGLPK
jgi:hypothetical protein